jgi:hypothetical protein
MTEGDVFGRVIKTHFRDGDGNMCSLRDTSSDWMIDQNLPGEERINAMNNFWSNELIARLRDEEWILTRMIGATPEERGKIEGLLYTKDSYTTFLNTCTLNGLLNCTIMKLADKSYKMHALDNNVLCVCVDDTASPVVKEAIKKFPAEYAELDTTEGRRKYMLWVLDEYIPEEARYLFDKTVSVTSEDQKVEVIFNDKWLNLTMNQLPEGEWTRFDKNNEGHRAKIEQTLKQFSELKPTGTIKRKSKYKGRKFAKNPFFYGLEV